MDHNISAEIKFLRRRIKMIPKVIHYCWFGGGKIDYKSRKCIKSWEKFFPDYEIKLWNEDNFNVNCCNYVKEAYREKMWAFVSDYARFKILSENGGIYFDTDVEVIKDMSDIVKKGSFMGCENNHGKTISVAPGLGMGGERGNSFFKEITEDYEKSSFYRENGEVNLYTVVERTTDLMKRKGLKDINDIQKVEDIYIYPSEYFCPTDLDTGKTKICENTYTIHHFAGSWVNKKDKARGYIYRFINRYFGKKTAEFVKRIFGKGNK